MKQLSIVIPCYNESESLFLLLDELNSVIRCIEEYETELIFVDDGSMDDTLDIIKAQAIINNNIKFISFSRNFGKEAAMLAGMTLANGDVITVMDADLQDPPSLLPLMLSSLEDGFDVVALNRKDRNGEPVLISFFSRLFYSIINYVSDVKITPGARDFRVMKRHVKDSFLLMQEYNRFSKGIFSWIGFKTKWIEYSNHTRAKGKSKWNFHKLCKYAIDGIISFTTVPLQIMLGTGVIASIIGFIYMLYIIFLKIVGGIEVPGYPSLMAVVLFLGGIQLLAIGIIGEYISKMYIEIKQRPKYLIKESNIEG